MSHERRLYSGCAWRISTGRTSTDNCDVTKITPQWFRKTATQLRRTEIPMGKPKSLPLRTSISAYYCVNTSWNAHNAQRQLARTGVLADDCMRPARGDAANWARRGGASAVRTYVGYPCRGLGINDRAGAPIGARALCAARRSPR